MIKVIKISSFCTAMILLLAGCSGNNNCDDHPGGLENVDIEIQRLEKTLLNIADRDELSSFLDREPVIAEFFLRQSEYPNRQIMVDQLIRRFTNPYIDSLTAEIDQIHGDLKWLEKDLEAAFSLLKHYYPEFDIPVVKTVATGFDYDLFVSDSLIVIGLDYYMGPEAKYRPMGTYNYILKRYDQQYIVPSIMLLYGISSQFNHHDPDDETILSDMMSYGKSFYFAKSMLPCTPDSTLIWYSDREMAAVDANDDLVWSHFIENNLLFETSHLIKRKYLDERPKTYEIGTECPPRIATWLGWEIVKKYMDDHPEVSLPELMKITEARRIFEESKYRPGT